MIHAKGSIVAYIIHYVKVIVWILIAILSTATYASCGQVARIEARIDDGRPENSYYVFPPQRYCGDDASTLKVHSPDGYLTLSLYINAIHNQGVSIDGTLSLDDGRQYHIKEFSLLLKRREKETVFIHTIPVTFRYEKMINKNS